MKKGKGTMFRIFSWLIAGGLAVIYFLGRIFKKKGD